MNMAKPRHLGPAVSGVCETRVHKVTRIHNRFLRNRFEEALESSTDTSDPGYKKNLEYLFHGMGGLQCEGNSPAAARPLRGNSISTL